MSGEPPKEKPATGEPKSVIRETDDDARRLARRLLHEARHVALAVLDPATGFPFVSRVLLGMDEDGAPVLCISALAAHSRALRADPRASILAGEPGKGDPLAYPRLTLQCVGEVVEDDGLRMHLRDRFLARHPKAKLYVDFPDFSFWKLTPQGASLNGGFGRAFILTGEDFAIPRWDTAKFKGSAEAFIQRLTHIVPDVANALAIGKCGAKAGKWRICGVDAGGIDLISGDNLLRYPFNAANPELDQIISDISKTE